MATLTLHGQTRVVAVEARETGGHYLRSSRFKQTDFGIKPVKVAGGTIRVKDEIRIELRAETTEARLGGNMIRLETFVYIMGATGILTINAMAQYGEQRWSGCGGSRRRRL